MKCREFKNKLIELGFVEKSLVRHGVVIGRRYVSEEDFVDFEYTNHFVTIKYKEDIFKDIDTTENHYCFENILRIIK